MTDGDAEQGEMHRHFKNFFPTIKVAISRARKLAKKNGVYMVVGVYYGRGVPGLDYYVIPERERHHDSGMFLAIVSPRNLSVTPEEGDLYG